MSMKVQPTDNHRDDYTADRRAEGLRQDFSELRGQIEGDCSLSDNKREQLLEELDGYKKLLIQREDSMFGDPDNRNDVGPMDGPNVGFDRNTVLRREYNQAVDGFRRLSEDFRAAKTDATAHATASAEVSVDDETLTVSAKATSRAVADVASTDICAPDCLQADSAEETSTPDGAEATSSASTGSDGDNTSIGALEFDGMSIDEMLNGLNDDPQAVMDHIQGLDEEDKQMAMQMLQQRLQQINQMFSMLSNLAKTAHDTAKASINNMRV
jgi:Mg2+ and Co2+ transporter CorA